MLSKESSDLSFEQKASNRNLVPLTKIFQIIPCQMDGKLTFPHVQLFRIWRTVFSRRDQKSNLCFLIGKRHLYLDILDADFDAHIRNMKRSVFLETNLEIMAFSDLRRLNNSIYTSLY